MEQGGGFVRLVQRRGDVEELPVDRVERLHAEAGLVHSDLPHRHDLLLVDALHLHLEGELFDLGHVEVIVNGLPDAANLRRGQRGRRSSAEEDGLDRAARDRLVLGLDLDFLDQRLDVELDRLVAGRAETSVQCAEGADGLAERDIEEASRTTR
ncbi:hypothetical protein OHA88_43395 [Streptomyces sp. NBC_00353]